MSSPVAGLSIQLIDADAMHETRTEILAVYRDAYADKIELPFFTEERFWERLAAYANRDGFGMVDARQDGHLVGYALGYPLPAGSRWWDGLITSVEPDLLTEDGSRTFALNYIMVRHSSRRQGVAKALHDALMGSRPELRATLLVLPDNLPASTAYASWGWRRIGGLKPFDDAPTYDALVLDLS
jgi:GNAT superfamily N-acetyltransferase